MVHSKIYNDEGKVSTGYDVVWKVNKKESESAAFENVEIQENRGKRMRRKNYIRNIENIRGKIEWVIGGLLLTLPFAFLCRNLLILYFNPAFLLSPLIILVNVQRQPTSIADVKECCHRIHSAQCSIGHLKELGPTLLLMIYSFTGDLSIVSSICCISYVTFK